MIGKCANNACREGFVYHAGGIFFRFSKGNIKPSLEQPATSETGNVHHVEHYWLCPRCARIYTLVHVEGAGVILRPLWMEQPIAEILKKVVAA